MGRLLLMVLGFVVVFGAAYFYVTGGARVSGGEAPQQRLENVNEAAQRIEDDAQKRVDDLAKKFE
ncbi:MAG TPA: hypothetical protein DFS52_12880 [Myxococcales bacterium]|nr:hypothetical protein [Myxococcales bacterium]